jgi:hypothetical protein
MFVTANFEDGSAHPDAGRRIASRDQTLTTTNVLLLACAGIKVRQISHFLWVGFA